MSLEQLYRDVITRHHKQPHGVGELDTPLNAERVNASCGDAVRVWVRLEDDRVADVRFRGKGCAVSVASASMMTDAVRGKTLAEVRELTASFRDVVMGASPPVPDIDSLGELMALSGVSKLHARRNCALLAWQTLEDALGAHGASA